MDTICIVPNTIYINNNCFIHRCVLFLIIFLLTLCHNYVCIILERTSCKSVRTMFVSYWRELHVSCQTCLQSYCIYLTIIFFLNILTKLIKKYLGYDITAIHLLLALNTNQSNLKSIPIRGTNVANNKSLSGDTKQNQ
jgi:predicted RecB family nuclease